MTVILRPATAADQKQIVAFIRAARINPMNLAWPHFILAVERESGALVGTGQIKTHGDGSRELASIAVAPAWQGQGVARQIIEYWLVRTTGPLYLTCRSRLETFYAKFGFRAVAPAEMPPYFRRLSRVAGVLRRLLRLTDAMLVMRRDG